MFWFSRGIDIRVDWFAWADSRDGRISFVWFFHSSEDEDVVNKRAHLFISGVVQGVFYRASVQQEAKDLSLHGYSRNLSDGRVEVVVEGDEAKIGNLIEWCRKGPPRARVDNVQVTWSRSTGEFTEFRTR